MSVHSKAEQTELEAARERLIVALDVSSTRQALHLIERLDGRCRWFKVGLELFLAEGPAVVRLLRKKGFDIFLDLKLHDIPNTVASAVRSVADLGASLLSIHALGGPAMLFAAQEAASCTPGMRLLGVTVLTSMNQQQQEQVGIAGTPEMEVRRLARLAVRAGLSGLVCSPEEVQALRREHGFGPVIVVPGIRVIPQDALPNRYHDDQVRIATPAAAIRSGASMLVVGRPITRASDPAEAAEQILGSIDAGLQPSLTSLQAE